MKITKQRLTKIIKEAIAEDLKADIAADQKKRGFKASGTGTPVPKSLDTADAWFNEFMKMIKREFNASGWSMAGIGSELLEAIEKLQRQVKDEISAADKKDYRE